MKTALITGASRGIGRATAKLLAEEGYAVAVNYNTSVDEALELCSEILSKGGNALPIKCDVSSSEAVDRMVKTVLEAFGHIDLLVCNAAIAEQKLVTELSDGDWRRMHAVNLDGVFYCARAVLPAMISRHSGKIVTVSSMWGVSGASCETHYSSSKAGLIGFTKALAREVGPSGITVNCVTPGFIDTDMNAALTDETRDALIASTPLMRAGRPEDVAACISFLASPAADFITAAVIPVDGGII